MYKYILAPEPLLGGRGINGMLMARRRRRRRIEDENSCVRLFLAMRLLPAPTPYSFEQASQVP